MTYCFSLYTFGQPRLLTLWEIAEISSISWIILVLWHGSHEYTISIIYVSFLKQEDKTFRTLIGKLRIIHVFGKLRIIHVFGKLRIIHVFGKLMIIHVFWWLRIIPKNVSHSYRSLTRNITVLTCTLIPLESFLCTHSIHVRNGMENLGNFVKYIYIQS